MGVGQDEFGITDENAVSLYVKEVNPGAIIHCAAYTAVDKAEDDKETCWNVNVEGTKFLAQVAKDVNAKFMYISTDYVFNGEGKIPFIEANQPSPVGYYGLTKYEGEKIVQQLLSEWFIEVFLGFLD
ncbi:SDR family oxidoreductase [Caldifermentibacillus hisashii]|uniref:SDR family oxidoreductase n=1 Tax=Caldifermentibacillus hisashii TaxID=996558 RepID=UPI003D22526B